MENSFFEYRNKTSDIISSDDEIDDSFIGNLSPGPKVTLSAKKNHTVFVPESEDSDTNEDTDYDTSVHQPAKYKGPQTRAAVQVVSSSDEEDHIKGSIRRQSGNSASNLEVSSSDDDQDYEDDASPEIVPRQRPIKKSTNSYDSPLIRRVRKRMILTDSENDNSIVIENDKHKKVTCLKDTPLKELESEKRAKDIVQIADMLTDDECNSDERSDDGTDDEGVDEVDDGVDEDELVMSKATRMSIMGFVPQGSDSEESDFIQSDESNHRSQSMAGSSGLPAEGLYQSPQKPITNEDLDSSKLSCSTFGSPAHEKTINIDNDVTRDINKTGEINENSENNNKTRDLEGEAYHVVDDIGDEIIQSYDKNVVIVDEKPGRNTQRISRISMGQKKSGSFKGFRKSSTEMDDDDDVSIIDSKPEIITLSSDDDDDYEKVKSPKTPAKPKTPKKSPNTSTSRQSKDTTMKQYLVPPSYPNQGVVFVKKSVKQNEMSKLNQLREDLHNVRYLLEHMDVETLPDRGVKLIERLNGLEAEVRRQGEKVAKMVEEPENPTAAQITQDGFDKGLTWDDIQKASNQVQPRMFGRQAMATHMAERDMMLERLRDLHDGLSTRPSEDQMEDPPKGLKTELMPHQLHALAWLKWREGQKPAGGILADDMGLGKTVTMISLILGNKEAKIDDDDENDDEWNGKENSKLARGGTLVVCPASLLQQWGDEVNKHCASHALSVELHHGGNRATQPRRLATHDLVVTTYNILQRDLENGVLMRIRWTRVILDEAHIVRNHKSQTSMAVSALKASKRWCLTGTPVQNKDLDVFALLKFLRCSPFDDLTIWKKWIDNKQMGGQERLSTIMSSLLLRRTKATLQSKGQLNCLPKREKHQVEVTLDKDEMNVYQKVLVFSKTLFAQFLHQRAEKNQNSANSLGFLPKPGKDDEYAKMHKKMVALQGAKPVKSHEILVLLLRLRQVCCHCGLIGAMLEPSEGAVPEEAGLDLLAELGRLTLGDKEGHKDDDEPDQEEEGTSVAEAIRSVMVADNPVFNMEKKSSKIRAVMQCLKNNVFKNKGHKAVVVSQWTSVLRLVESELNREGIKSVTLSGQVAVPARQLLIKALNDPRSDVKVMLLSLCAGGVGLNLCGANHLLLLDPHWNPQLEEQAQDRIYRVGQTRDVHIYRFMCLDTVEQSIRKLQEAKLELAENVLTGARNNNASKLTIEDLKTLFNMGG